MIEPTLAELTGFMAAIDARMARVTPPPERPRPIVLPTYNGARRHPNLTPLLALLLARYGVPVVLHGMTDEGNDDGCVSTAAILWELGIEPVASVAEAQARLAARLIAYVPTPLLSPQLASLLALRQRMGIRSVAHTLAKLVDPVAGGGLRVVAVTDPGCLARMHEFLTAAHASALLMLGTEGEPYANPRRQPRIEAFDGGAATVLFDAETDAPSAQQQLPSSVDAPTTAAWTRAALAGEVAIPQPIVNQLACCLQCVHAARGARGVSRDNCAASPHP